MPTIRLAVRKDNEGVAMLWALDYGTRWASRKLVETQPEDMIERTDSLSSLSSCEDDADEDSDIYGGLKSLISKVESNKQIVAEEQAALSYVITSSMLKDKSEGNLRKVVLSKKLVLIPGEDFSSDNYELPIDGSDNGSKLRIAVSERCMTICCDDDSFADELRAMEKCWNKKTNQDISVAGESSFPQKNLLGVVLDVCPDKERKEAMIERARKESPGRQRIQVLVRAQQHISKLGVGIAQLKDKRARMEQNIARIQRLVAPSAPRRAWLVRMICRLQVHWLAAKVRRLEKHMALKNHKKEALEGLVAGQGDISGCDQLARQGVFSKTRGICNSLQRLQRNRGATASIDCFSPRRSGRR